MKKILIVDDEQKIRNLLCRFLRKEGYDVICIDSPEKALQVIDKDRGITMVILDILMPAFNGLDVFDGIKKKYPKIKIIISSVYSRRDQEFLIDKADEYYCKHDELSILRNKVNNIFGQIAV